MFSTVLMVFSLGLMGRAGRPALGYSKETARDKRGKKAGRNQGVEEQHYRNGRHTCAKTGQVVMDTIVTMVTLVSTCRRIPAPNVARMF